MERIDRVIEHELFQSSLKQLEALEVDRIFCKHNLSHFLDVARVAYILSLEQNAMVSKEEIYATALLHDIGRHEQYLYGIPHDEASARIAEQILRACGFSEEEKERIVYAILEHRTGSVQESQLSEMICRADKITRPCYGCQAEAECNWSAQKKNRNLQY